MDLTYIAQRLKRLTGQDLQTDAQDNYWIYHCTYVVAFTAEGLTKGRMTKIINVWQPGNKRKPVKFVNADQAIDFIELKTKTVII